MKKPIQRHPYCKLDRCKICLEDCNDLADYLEEKTGIEARFMDHLGAYRMYLDKKGIHSESDYGWPLPMVFDLENIEGYLAKYKDDDET